MNETTTTAAHTHSADPIWASGGPGKSAFSDYRWECACGHRYGNATREEGDVSAQHAAHLAEARAEGTPDRHPRRKAHPMYVDVKYAARVQIGDMFAGTVNPAAPTRPCQPCASAMRVSAVETMPDPERPRGTLYRFRFDGLAGLPSGHYRPADQILTIVS